MIDPVAGTFQPIITEHAIRQLEDDCTPVLHESPVFKTDADRPKRIVKDIPSWSSSSAEKSSLS
jgi:hypothetical protein